MEKELTAKQLREMFPDDDACLEHIMRIRYGDRHTCGKCERDAHFYRTKGRRSYTCEHCGNQVYPTAGTPFHKSRTSLVDWFTVMHMFTTTRNGVAAKEIQRSIGVTYKTAWRMGHIIREYMAYIDGDEFVGGGGMGDPWVEVDETYIGGKKRGGQGGKGKKVVLGIVERGSEVILRHVRSRRANHLIPHIAHWVRGASKIASDELPSYDELYKHGYSHRTVNHSKKEYVRGAVHTNSIEGVWSNVKRTINGTHVWVSQKWLQNYLWETEFRHNLRKTPGKMMRLMLTCFPPALPMPSHPEGG